MPAHRFRKATLKDAQKLYDAHQLPFVREYVRPIPLEAIRDIIRSEDEEYLVSVDGDENLIAFAHLHGLTNPNRSIELRQLGVCTPGMGCGTAFLRSVSIYAFRDLSANRFWLDVFPQNERARHVYKKLGFIEEGLLRDAYLWNGTFQSTIIMSILARDFDA